MRALHFRCDARDHPKVKPKLKEMFSSTGAVDYLLGVKLCLVLEISSVTNFTAGVKSSNFETDKLNLISILSLLSFGW